MRSSSRLERLTGGADEIAQHGDVRAVGADAAGVHGKAKALGEIEIDTGVIEFGKTETLRGQTRGSNPSDRRGEADDDAAKDGAPVRKIAANRVCAKSSSLSLLRPLSSAWMHGAARRFVSNLSSIAQLTRSPQCRATLPQEMGGQALNILHIRHSVRHFTLPIVSNTLPGDLFRCAGPLR